MANDNTGTQAPQSPTSNPMLKPLDALVGEWVMEGSHPFDPSIKVRGRETFEWMEGGAFLIERWTVEHPDFPDGIAIIGLDEATGNLLQHYFDSRGVHRIYNMSLSDGVWKLWRDDPDFSQRFTGTFSDNGNTITGAFEKAMDGTTWEHDFDITYKRVG
jgi:hypothetical protein